MSVPVLRRCSGFIRTKPPRWLLRTPAHRTLPECLSFVNSEDDRQNHQQQTLGLMAVCYRLWDRCPVFPRIKSCEKLSLQDWKDFLKICLDFMFRANGATDFSKTGEWLGMSYNQVTCCLPTEKTITAFSSSGPSAAVTDRTDLCAFSERALHLNADHGSMLISLTAFFSRHGSAYKPPGLCSSHEDGILLKRTRPWASRR